MSELSGIMLEESKIEKKRFLKEMERMTIVLISREKKIRPEINRMYKEKEDEYQQLYIKSGLKDSLEKLFLNDESLSYFKKVAGIYLDAVENGNKKPLESLIQKIDTAATLIAKKNRVIDNAVTEKIKETLYKKVSPHNDLEMIKAILFPTILANLEEVNIANEEIERQQNIHKKIKKRIETKQQLSNKTITLKKEDKERLGLKALSGKTISPAELTSLVRFNTCKKYIVKKMPSKEKNGVIGFNISQYRRFYENQTDIEKVYEAIGAAFDLNNVFMESYEEEYSTKELYAVYEAFQKEMGELEHNEEPVIYLLLFIIYSLAKEKQEKRQQLELKEREAEKSVENEIRESREVESLKHQLREEQREKRMMVVQNKKLLQENKNLKEMGNKKEKEKEKLKEDEEYKKMKEELTALREAFYDQKNNCDLDVGDTTLEEKITFLRGQKLLFVGGYKQWKKRMKEALPNAKFYSEETFINQNSSFVKEYDYVMINNMGISHASTGKTASAFENRNKVIFLIGFSNFERTINYIYDKIN